MDIIEELKQEHEQIERELVELEYIIESEIINYANLIHTLRAIYMIWDIHEKKEEAFFPFLEKVVIGIKIPVQKMLFEHKVLRPHRQAIRKAINSGSDYEIKNVLSENGRIMILRLRAHMNFEDEVLYRIEMPELSEGKTDELKVLLSEIKN